MYNLNSYDIFNLKGRLKLYFAKHMPHQLYKCIVTTVTSYVALHLATIGRLSQPPSVAGQELAYFVYMKYQNTLTVIEVAEFLAHTNHC